jgi:hypothetical protein
MAAACIVRARARAARHQENSLTDAHLQSSFTSPMKPSLLVAAALPVTVAAATAHADRRTFTLVNEYLTQTVGETELELYSDQARSAFDDPATKRFELSLAIEHGITDRWDVSLYHAFAEATDDPLHFAELGVRSRYRFSDRGRLPVDLQLSADASKAFGVGAYAGELRLVLARDVVDRLGVVVNGIGEARLGPAVDDPELFAGWAAGASFEVLTELRIGAETRGRYALEVEDGEEPLAVTAGPVISWAPASRLWATVGAGFAVTDNVDELTIRVMVGAKL